MTPEQKTEKARQCKAVLDNPEFQNCFAEIDAALIARAKKVDLTNVAEKDAIIYSIQILEKIKQYFFAWMHNEKVSAFNEAKKRKVSTVNKSAE